MKIKFDENISTRLVDAIRRLEIDASIELGSVLEDYSQGTADPEWMFRFRDEGRVAQWFRETTTFFRSRSILLPTQPPALSQFGRLPGGRN